MDIFSKGKTNFILKLALDIDIIDFPFYEWGNHWWENYKNFPESPHQGSFTARNSYFESSASSTSAELWRINENLRGSQGRCRNKWGSPAVSKKQLRGQSFWKSSVQRASWGILISWECWESYWTIEAESTIALLNDLSSPLTFVCYDPDTAEWSVGVHMAFLQIHTWPSTLLHKLP